MARVRPGLTHRWRNFYTWRHTLSPLWRCSAHTCKARVVASAVDGASQYATPTWRVLTLPVEICELQTTSTPCTTHTQLDRSTCRQRYTHTTAQTTHCIALYRQPVRAPHYKHGVRLLHSTAAAYEQCLVCRTPLPCRMASYSTNTAVVDALAVGGQ